MNKTKLLLFLFIFALSTTNISAQVTIGSSAKPNEGALLDIKEFDDAIARSGGRTATKGLLMPRVALVENYTLLPLSSDESNQNKETYAGAIVYNTKQDIIADDSGCTNEVDFIYAGINAWNGKRWVPIGYTPVDTMAYLTKVKIIKDHEGNEYTSGKFGDAGTWMTQNLRTKTFPPNLNISTEITLHSLSPRSTHKDAIYGYPRKENRQVITDPIDFNAAPEAGLLYSRATVYTTPGSDPGSKADATQFISPYQGICPEGWHVPTSDEWILLANEIRTKTAEYTIYEPGESFYSNKAILSACDLFGPTENTKSKSPLLGGFGAYFVAWANISTGKIANNIVAEFSSINSSTNLAGFTSMRGVQSESIGTQNDWADDQLMSLRCKKDIDD